jgi:outer membrane protein OmpA-like peptidoglycan-associated protein
MQTSALSLILLLLFIPGISVVSAADLEGSKDHPQIKRYEGAEIVKYEFREYDELTIPLGKAKHSLELEDFMQVEGAITRLTYTIPMGRSPLEVIRNYETEFQAHGFQELFAGSGNELGSGFSEAAGYKEIKWSPNIPALTLNGDSQRFLAMEKKGSGGNIFVLLYAVKNRFWAGNLDEKEGIAKGQTLLQVDVVESKPMEVKMVTVAAEEMAERISTSGSVALYGIYFDIDKTDLRPESGETLVQIAKLLKDNDSLNLLVVGHTDNVGSFSYNRDLSQKRASAVVKELGKTYGVNTSRLKPVGVSFACPVASNKTEENRAKNRRVELVEFLPE